MLGRDDDEMTQEELIKLRQEKQREQSQDQLAQSVAEKAATAQGAAAPGYWDVVGDPDVSRDSDDGLGEFTATELSDKFALGNIKYDDWESWNWRTENEFWTMRNEFKDQDTKLDGDDMRMMYGKDRPELSNEKERRLRSTMQVKKLMTSLSVGARGLRSGTEIHAVTKREEGEPGEGEGDKGLFGRAKDYLSG